MHTKGFEFTHHDVISNTLDRKSYKRKVKRINDIRGNYNICFFYHYRICNGNDLNLISEKAEEFLDFYLINDCHCELVIFTQNIISNIKDRGIQRNVHNDNILIYTNLYK